MPWHQGSLTLIAVAITLQAKQEVIVYRAVVWRDVLARLVQSSVIDPSKRIFIRSPFLRVVSPFTPWNWTAGLAK